MKAIVNIFLLALLAQPVIAQVYIAHDHRWMVSEQPSGLIKPPLKLLWEKAPISLFPPAFASRSEWTSRRIALTEHGLVSVIRRNLYVLDKDNGSVLWTRALPGDDITDWIVTGGIFLYTSVDYQPNQLIRGSFDIPQRKELWRQRDAKPTGRQGERLLASGDGLVVFFSDGGDRHFNDAIIAIDYKTGEEKWRSSTDVERVTLVPFSWFIFGSHLHALIGPRGEGLFLKKFSLTDGTSEAPSQIYASSAPALPSPPVMNSNGKLLVAHNKLSRLAPLTLLSYDTTTGKPLWSKDLGISDPDELNTFRRILQTNAGDTSVATVRPDRFVVFDSDNGSVIRDARLPGYVGWVEHNASLYSHPYLFTGATRKSWRGMSFDLIALNIETGKVDWSYAIETRSQPFSVPTRDLLNFIVKDDRVYVARTDAKIMAFQYGESATKPAK